MCVQLAVLALLKPHFQTFKLPLLFVTVGNTDVTSLCAPAVVLLSSSTSILSATHAL